MDEDRCRVALEHNIGSSRQAGDVLSEPKAVTMEMRSNPPLRRRLRTSDQASLCGCAFGTKPYRSWFRTRGLGAIGHRELLGNRVPVQKHPQGAADEPAQ